MRLYIVKNSTENPFEIMNAQYSGLKFATFYTMEWFIIMFTGVQS